MTDEGGVIQHNQQHLQGSPEGRERRTEDHQRLLGICKEIGKMLDKIMKEPEKWCSRFRPL